MACSAKRIVGFNVHIFMVVTLMGCAVPNANIDAPSGAGINSGVVYQPKASTGIQSPDAAKADLVVLLEKRQRPVGITFGTGRYYSEQDLNLYANQGELAALNMGGTGGVSRLYDADGPNARLTYFLFKSMTVLDDRIQICPRIALCYTDLMRGPISVTTRKDKHPYIYTVQLWDQILFHFHKGDLVAAQRLADDLFVIQEHLEKQEKARLTLFEEKAVQYRDMAVKPQMSQEQRKYIIQADVLATQKKDYEGAIGLYLKAIDLDPVSHPEAYINLAMLSAQQKRFKSAISYMKQYLRLVPDAQNAQDKIYEWELLMKK